MRSVLGEARKVKVVVSSPDSMTMHVQYILSFPWQGGRQCSLKLLIQPWICAPGRPTHYGWVDRSSVAYKVSLTLLHIASTGNPPPPHPKESVCVWGGGGGRGRGRGVFFTAYGFFQFQSQYFHFSDKRDRFEGEGGGGGGRHQRKLLLIIIQITVKNHLASKG